MIPNSQSSSCTLQYIPSHVCCSSTVVLFSRFIERFPGNDSKCFFTILLLFHWLHLSPAQQYISCSTFGVSLYINSCINFFSASFFVSVRWYWQNYQYACLLFFVFNYYIWPICRNFFIRVTSSRSHIIIVISSSSSISRNSSDSVLTGPYAVRSEFRSRLGHRFFSSAERADQLWDSSAACNETLCLG